MTRDAMRASDAKGDEARYLRGRPARSVPILRLLVYYVVVIAAALLLMWLVPATRDAIIAPISAGGGELGEFVTGRSSAATAQTAPLPWGGPWGRLGLTIFAAFGAFVLALPVAWVHMFTRRLRYDPSLVQSVVILPIVVAGVVLVVKNSLALAFALAGIVAGVRFRQKLSEPQEAVYVLLALGIGLAAGVQALDVALAVSLLFNVVVLALWRYDLGSMYAPGGQPMLATGDTSLVIGRRAMDRDALGERLAADAAGMDLDGILVVHATNPDAAEHGLEVSLGTRAKDWRMLPPIAEGKGMSRMNVLVRLAKDEDPVELLGELEERWSAYIAAAEYIPHRVRKDEENDED